MEEKSDDRASSLEASQPLRELKDKLQLNRQNRTHHWPLWRQMATSLGLTILLVGFGAEKLVRTWETRHLLHSLAKQSDKTAALLSAVSVDAVISQDRPLLETIVQQSIGQDPSIVSLSIQNVEGQPLIDWQNPGPPTLADRLSFTKDITYQGENFGTLTIAWDVTDTYQQIERHVQRMRWVAISILLLLAGIILALLHQFLVHPIHQIDQRLLDLSLGDLESKLRLPTSASQELIRLGDSVNALGEDILKRQQVEAALRKREQQLQDQAQKLERTLQQLQQAQTQLIQSEKMSSLGQLVAGVAHEINNPVSFIYGNLVHVRQYADDLLKLVQLFQAQYPNPPSELQAAIEDKELDFLSEDLPKTLNSMEMGADRIREIVLSLRNFSRLDESEAKQVDIHDGLDSTLMILQNRLKAQPDRPEIEVIKKYDCLPPISCYPGQLNQVFMNVISNAVDALEEFFFDRKTTQKMRIRIETKIKKDRVLILIADNGIGIIPEKQKQLFDPFFTTKPVGKGTGMGLAISYQVVVEKHKGQLTCVSVPEQGTEFLIEIPIQQ